MHQYHCCEKCSEPLDRCGCPDLEPEWTHLDYYTQYFNRAAEETARWLRALGLI